MNEMKTGKDILKLRKKLGISQQKMAELIGVSYSWISKIEIYDHNLGELFLIKLERAKDKLK